MIFNVFGIHIVSVSLFWKHLRESDPDLPEPTCELMMNAKQLGLVRRFSLWETYVEPLLHAVPVHREQYPGVVFRVYLARDLEFLIGDLIQAGCEVYWMKSFSIRLVPGSLWRLLAFEKHGKVITMLDGNLMERTPEFIARTEDMANANLGVWQPFRHARGLACQATDECIYVALPQGVHANLGQFTKWWTFNSEASALA